MNISDATTPFDQLPGIHSVAQPPVLPSTLPPPIRNTSSPLTTPPTSPPPVPPKPKLVSKHTSKSLNDISHIAESIQGIASISANRVPCKPNYAQIMRMTKELLLNSSIEASLVLNRLRILINNVILSMVIYRLLNFV